MFQHAYIITQVTNPSPFFLHFPQPFNRIDSRGNRIVLVATDESMVVEMVPLKGGIGGIVHPPIGRKNTTYSPCRTWGVKNATYHLLGEPETTIE